MSTEGTNKETAVQIGNGILFIHKSKSQAFATTRMDHEGTVLCEINRRKTKPYDVTMCEI